jgi:hypothetical protein
VNQRLLTATCVVKQLQQQTAEFKRKFGSSGTADAAAADAAKEAPTAPADGADAQAADTPAAAAGAASDPEERSSKRQKLQTAVNGAKLQQQGAGGSDSAADSLSGSSGSMGGSDDLLGSSGSRSDDASSQEGVRGQPMIDNSEGPGSAGADSDSDGGGDRGIDSDGVDLEAEYEVQLAAEQWAGDESPSEAELDESTLAALQTLRAKRWEAFV